MLSRHDYVMRLVKQLAELLARVLKLPREQARPQLEQACGELLGIEYSVLMMLDARSAVELLGEQARVDAFLQLLEAMGEHARAEELRAVSRTSR